MNRLLTKLVAKACLTELPYMPHECLFGMALHGWTVAVIPNKCVGTFTVTATKGDGSLSLTGSFKDTPSEFIGILNGLVSMTKDADRID